ncbi:hypothetical protein BpHYR1_011007 [Brachionus plicatilis]|uniref:FCS-type domain-containing protein n=1 Tax=Brachionus plicatilis TaxID=10195 RepID=A0A3M7PQY6_BRAPC|nr:hypothetical protein BpHYR1_011007 [Brachionus plicatilis]
MSQQNSNIQPSINTSSQNSPSISHNVQKNSSTPGTQSSKNIQILNPMNSNINLNQTSGLTFTLENNNVKPSSLKINQMTGSTVTLIPAINSGSSNTAQNNPSNSNNVSSSMSQTNTNSSSLSSSTSTYGGFAYCSNCGEYGVKAAFYGKSKLYCSVACQNGIKKQQQQQNHGIKRTVEAL